MGVTNLIVIRRSGHSCGLSGADKKAALMKIRKEGMIHTLIEIDVSERTSQFVVRDVFAFVVLCDVSVDFLRDVRDNIETLSQHLAPVSVGNAWRTPSMLPYP